MSFRRCSHWLTSSSEAISGTSEYQLSQWHGFYHLRRLRADQRSVSMPVFKSMVHAFVCSRIDYCNSLLIGLPKSRLAPLQSVLNAAARLIARIPRFSYISTFMTEQLHWLPLSARTHFKIIFLVYKAFLGLAPSYLCKVIMRPLSAISDRPLRSLVRNDLLVPRSRTSTSQQFLLQLVLSCGIVSL